MYMFTLIIIYTSAACHACDKYDLWTITWYNQNLVPINNKISINWLLGFVALQNSNKKWKSSTAQCKILLGYEYNSVWRNHLDQAKLKVTIKQMEIYGFDKKDVNVKTKVIKSNKCNQCDYASSQAGHLRRHLKKHSGEKPNKCNQCDYASAHASAMRTHLKTRSGEKLNKCNQCDFAYLQAGHLRQHLKTHSGENPNKRNQCDFASCYASALRTLLKWR